MQTSRSNPSPSVNICVPVCEKDFGTLRNACERAVEWADFIELRLDCLEGEPANVAQVLRKVSRPVILTFRPSEQGGHRNLSREERERFWRTAPRGESIWWDVEGDLVQDLSPDWPRVIASHHDFSGVPNDLQQIYERLAST